MEALGEEHQRRRVRVLGAAEELGEVAASQPEIEQRHVRDERRSGERVEDRACERRRHGAAAHAVPLHLAVERPAVRAQRLLPAVAQQMPVAVAHGDPAEREHSVPVEPPALVEEQQMHARIVARSARAAAPVDESLHPPVRKSR